MIQTRRVDCILLLFLLLIGQVGLAQTVPMDSGLPLFADTDTLAVTIEGPLTSLTRERSNEEYYQGTLRFPGADGQSQALDLQFRTRGNFRRKPSTCRFPPVRLNLKKKQVEGTLFAGQNILKLVTHCRPGNSRYEQYVLKEALTYRILNLHTPLSFRTRLLKITWVNTEDDNEADVRYGFLIEHKNELTARAGMTEFTGERSSYNDLDPRQSAIAAVFEFLIGNTDFSMVAAPPGESCCHNGILLADSNDRHHFVPYDFDLGGIVNAPYAKPNPQFNLRSVTDRLYRGHCRFNPEMEAVGQLYRDKQIDVMQAVEDLEGLDDKNQRTVRRYLDLFYEKIATPESMRKNLLDECVGKAA